jgi:hypothetical protein
MQSHPGRVSDDHIEPAARGDVREVGREDEWGRVPIAQSFDLASQRTNISAYRAQRLALHWRQASAIAKEIGSARGGQKLPPHRCARNEAIVYDAHRVLALGAIERAAQSLLASAVGAGVAGSQHRER